jgi:hypothetical protein
LDPLAPVSTGREGMVARPRLVNRPDSDRLNSIFLSYIHDRIK